MCGIVGIIQSSTAEENGRIVHNMNNAIVHRGPDDDGVWATEHFAFGMRRLSIIDLHGGKQPMWLANDEGGFGIVFNGEIYNFKELRNELSKAGASFRTNSDTEVILKLFQRYGLDGVSKLNGMFAICLYDPKEQKIHLVRDRMGIKPLYYTSADRDRFVFGSEIKAVLSGDLERVLDEQAMHDYLSLRFVPGPGTVWKGIRQLEPGRILTVDIKTRAQSTRRFWSTSFESEPFDPERNYDAEFEQLFTAAVDRRLLAADVPVGVLLSGGLDSSAVCASAIELGHKAFNTFSIAFDEGGDFSEFRFARQVAKKLGSNHHEIQIGQQDFLDTIPKLCHYADQPLADLASIPLFHVSGLARESVKVVLSGEGADEIFGGYDFEKLAMRLEFLKNLEKVMPKSIMRLVAKLMPSERAQVLNGLCSGGWTGYLAARRSFISKSWSEEEKQQLWLNGSGFTSTDDLIESWYHKTSSLHPIDQMMGVYCSSWLVEDLLMKADKMSMAQSLELRVPFLDHTLVEWAAKLPLQCKVGSKQIGWSSKHILRRFAARRLPKEILERPKQGFPVPAYNWLETQFADKVAGLLGKSSKLSGFFDHKIMSEQLISARAGNRIASHKVWQLVILEYWLQEWT